MELSNQRYEVEQIFAECRESGVPLFLACVAVQLWFDRNKITPPKSILDWLGGKVTPH